jgi:cytochrome b pre-mRNA-processing protein 3
MFATNNHKIDLYNNLLLLSRNIFFYEKIKLPDKFETRIYLMFFHFAILMIISKKKGNKFDQKLYDYFFYNIENNLRELGFGDVTVNKKMKELNKVLYDILLKMERKNDKDIFSINSELLIKYFKEIKSPKSSEFKNIKIYLTNFFHFCFDMPMKNMVKDCIKFKL